MKHISLIKKSLILAFGVFALIATSSCVREDIDECYTLRLTVVNNNGEDITGSANVAAILYIFGEDQTYLGKKELSKEEVAAHGNIVLQGYPNNKKLNIIAWCGTEGEQEEVASMKETDVISKMQIALKTKSDNVGGTIATAPDRLYYGQELITTKSSDEVPLNQEIIVRPKIGAINIRTIGLNQSVYTKASNASLNYYVRRTLSGFDYQGQMMGDSVSYNPEANFVTSGTYAGEFVAPTSNLLPSNSIAVDLYNTKSRMFSVSKDDNGVPFTTHQDSTLYVVIRLGEMSNVISVKAVVRPWGEVYDPHDF